MNLGRVRRHLGSNVVAYLALFLALGGGAYAATKAAKNTVVSKSIKNGQVKKKDLGDNSVISQKVKDGTLQSADFAPGAAGVSNYVTYEASSESGGGDIKNATATCLDPDTEVVGGGSFIEGAGFTAVAIDADGPTNPSDPDAVSETQWFVSAHEHTPTAESWTVHAYVLCGETSP
jgi:hypothetical protein